MEVRKKKRSSRRGSFDRTRASKEAFSATLFGSSVVGRKVEEGMKYGVLHVNAAVSVFLKLFFYFVPERPREEKGVFCLLVELQNFYLGYVS